MKQQAKLSLSTEVKEELKAFADHLGLTQIKCISYLIEFYNLRHLDRLIGLISKKAVTGFNHVELAQLSALYTLLSHIKDQVGFR